MCCVLPDQLWQHLMSHWFANRALWTAVDNDITGSEDVITTSGMICAWSFEPPCCLPAFGNVCLTGFLLRSSFSSPVLSDGELSQAFSRSERRIPLTLWTLRIDVVLVWKELTLWTKRNQRFLKPLFCHHSTVKEEAAHSFLASC